MIVVKFGSIEAFLKLVAIAARPTATHGERKAVWRRFGMWLLLGLEFELRPTSSGVSCRRRGQDIGELGAIAVIRTFLNYFLERDLEASGESAEPPVTARRTDA